MEAANVLLAPALAYVLERPRMPIEWLAFSTAALAASSLLIIGAVYWFALDLRLRGNRDLLQKWLRIADRADRPVLALLAAAAGSTIVAAGALGFTDAFIAASALTGLAALEYVNYYHWQLQHFDNWADFKRLLALRPLKQAHSARSLAAYRRSAG